MVMLNKSLTDGETTAQEISRRESIEEAFISKYWECIVTDVAQFNLSLPESLKHHFPHLDASSWESRLAWGGLFVNGEEIRSLETPLPFPYRLEYYEPCFDYLNPHSFFPRFSPEWIVYEDNEVICSFKPNKLPSMPAREQTEYCLKKYLEKHLRCKLHMPSRLDMSTSGLVVMSKSPDHHNKLQRAFETRRVEKSYLFETASNVPFEEHQAVGAIGKDPEHPVLRKVVEEGGKPSLTHFKVITRGETTIVEAQPKTGRTHQIRVHARHLGIPILGDMFYEGAPAESLHLLSYRIRFPHPRTQEYVTVVIPERLVPEWALGAVRGFGGF